MRISDWSSDVCSSDLWDAERHEAQRKELEELVKATQKESEKLGVLGHGMHQPFETMFQDVFEEMPWHLKEQCTQMLAEREAKFGPHWKPQCSPANPDPDRNSALWGKRDTARLTTGRPRP